MLLMAAVKSLSPPSPEQEKDISIWTFISATLTSRLAYLLGGGDVSLFLSLFSNVNEEPHPVTSENMDS